MKKEQTGQGALDGIRVVDLSSVVSGPLCTQILGDLGAEVLKVESLVGDISRRLGPPFQDGLTPLYAQFNRNKRSLSVDLKVEAGIDLVRRLAAEADVFIENFRPGVVDRLGLGYETLRSENPGLVYVSINGFGPEGPYRDLPAYDSVIQGLTGFMQTQGGADGPPALVKNLIADKTTAMTATYGVLAALLARERGDGQGQKVTIPMLDAFAGFILPDLMGPETFPPVDESAPPPVDIHRSWETRDGYVVMMVIEDHQFHAVCRALGREDWIEDPQSATLIQRLLNAAELFPRLEEECRKWDTAELVARAREFGAPLAPANGLQDFLSDPQVAANRTVQDIDDRSGTVRVFRNPVRFSQTPTREAVSPPRLGEHTDEILSQAGLDAEAIEALRGDGVVS